MFFYYIELDIISTYMKSIYALYLHGIKTKIYFMKCELPKYYILIGTILLFSSFKIGQLTNSYLNDEDKVAFVKTNITHNGKFLHIITYSQAILFPHLKVHFYNKGVSGHIAFCIFKCYNSDVAVNIPTKIPKFMKPYRSSNSIFQLLLC